MRARLIRAVGGYWNSYEYTKSKIMASTGILLLAVYGRHFLSGVQVYGIRLGWPTWLLIYVTPQRVGCDRRPFARSRGALWIRDTDTFH